MPENRYSFFDFDNTLYKGQSGYLIRDFSIYLESKRAFYTEQLSQILSLVTSYETGQITRHDFAVQIVEAYYLGLDGRTEHQIDIHAKYFWGSLTKEAWFSYTQPLLDLIKEFTIPILISGSPIEVLRHVSGKFGLYEVYASQGNIQKGEYHGGMHHELASQIAKKRLMADLVPNLKVDRGFSFAFGDSESDFPLLEAVDPQNAYLLCEDQQIKNKPGNQKWNYLKKNIKIVDHVRKRLIALEATPDSGN